MSTERYKIKDDGGRDAVVTKDTLYQIIMAAAQRWSAAYIFDIDGTFRRVSTNGFTYQSLNQ